MQDRGILIILCLEYDVFLLVQFLKCSETILPPCPVQKVILSKKEEGHLAASDPVAQNYWGKGFYASFISTTYFLAALKKT